MRGRPARSRGFTLIELIASVTIIAILAAVVLPRTTAAQPFQEAAYADSVATALRHARNVSLASGCEVQFTVDAAGYRALQRGASGAGANHCATTGAWITPVQRGDGAPLAASQPPGVTLATNRQFVFAADGTVSAGPFTIVLGPQALTVDSSGLVQGP